MINTSDIRVGQVVKSKAGRDKEEFFVVLEVIDDQYLSLVNGARRKLESPKRKKVKHLMITKQMVDLQPTSKTLNDSYIRKELSRFQEA
ncbi:KOW domain-containing RNA-binding protein [Peptoniphilus sp. KCTC 25270]|uniref:KOW domain-containing RNA-binding protein n=1 Tax=Peptoniphilus sp. KCTC 25270 TaxID=2897414 RepID=UPI001E2FA7AF|nr:KOW domain-containing RNA-binding protein [Peptoniphilus sp. KCTC 25270]MCD1147341.1 KOW domain-containing RNA-binding protein [Peptoniphilus sp. KCTC 25270]